MKVSEICKDNVVTIRGFDELSMAAQRMRERHVGYLVVVEPIFQGAEPQGRYGQRPIGVLTDRDLVVSVLSSGTDPRTLKVEDVMTARPVTAREGEDVADALLKMRSIGVRRLPVVSTQGALVGILALDDILDSIVGELQNVIGSVHQEQKMERAVRP